MLNFKMRRSAPQPLNPAPSRFGPQVRRQTRAWGSAFRESSRQPLHWRFPVFAQTARNINNSTFFFSQILLATIMVIYQVANFVVSHSL